MTQDLPPENAARSHPAEDPLLRARELMRACNFAAAVEVLASVPREQRQPAITSLQVQLQFLQGLREEAFDRMAQPGDASAVVERYVRALQSEGLHDAELEQRIQKLTRSDDSATGNRTALIVVALTAALILAGVLWLTSEPGGQPRDKTSPGKADLEKTKATRELARNRFASALRSARAGNSSEAQALWASAMAVSDQDEAAEVLEEDWNQNQQRYASVNAADSTAVSQELQQLEKLAAAAEDGNNSIRVRFVRCQILQTAADLLMRNGDYGDALGMIQRAALLVPADQHNADLAGRAIEGMISAGAGGDLRFPSEIIIPIIDNAGTAGVDTLSRQRLRGLLRNSQHSQLEAFIKLPHDVPLQRPLQALKAIQLEGSLPAGSSELAAFEQAVESRIAADLEAGRFPEAVSDFLQLEDTNLKGHFPELRQQLSESLSQRAQAAFAAGRLESAAALCDLLTKLDPQLPDAVLNALRLLNRRQLEQLPDIISLQVLVRTSTIGQRFLLIERGRFERQTESGKAAVTLSSWYYIAATELTRGQYAAVMGQLPADSVQRDAASSQVVQTGPLSDFCPVLLTWDQALEFCKVLSQRPEEQQRGQSYRLATEAEWEFACLSGTNGPWCFGEQQQRLSEFAWFDSNSGGRLQEVGKLQPSSWGLFDLHGNAEEWVSDWFGAYPQGDQQDPAGPDSGELRAVRGGSFSSPPPLLVTNARRGLPPQTSRCGVRLVQVIRAPGIRQD